MPSPLRDVTIRMGRKSYFLKTALDDESLSRISSISSEITKSFSSSLEQEDLLLLSCLQLAWSLEKIGAKMESAVALAEEAARS